MAERSPTQLLRCGGDPALDFLNTVDWRGRAQPEEYLFTYADLVVWSELAGLISQRRAQRLKRTTSNAAGTGILEDALALREALYRVLSAAIAGKVPSTNDMRRIDAIVCEVRNHLELSYENNEFAWELVDETDARLPLWRIALSVVSLLENSAVNQIRLCDGPECGWLFLDVSKNRSRRWCSMDGCGNRAKARRHYARAGER